MTALDLQNYLKAHYPKENEACEWKEFKNLKHSISGARGEDLATYISAIANMNGGHIIIGVKDGTLDIVGIENLHEYAPETLPHRLLGVCPNLSSEGLSVEAYTTIDTARTFGSSISLNICHVSPYTLITRHGNEAVIVSSNSELNEKMLFWRNR